MGYANPHLYANGSPRRPIAYVELTAGYLQKLDIDILNPYHMSYEIDHQNIADFRPLAEGYVAAREILQRYLRQIPFLKGVFPDYARTRGMTYPMSHYLLQAGDRKVPVIHAMTEHFWPSKGKEGDIAARIEEIRRRPTASGRRSSTPLPSTGVSIPTTSPRSWKGWARTSSRSGLISSPSWCGSTWVDERR